MKSKLLDFRGRTYTVFEDGKIIGSSGKELTWRYDKDGYPIVSVAGRSIGVHRLVAMAFVPKDYRGYNKPLR